MTSPRINPREIPLIEITDRIRRLAAMWFRNSDLLLLEELIRRVQQKDTKQDE